jgi:hypothetical protein
MKNKKFDKNLLFYGLGVIALIFVLSLAFEFSSLTGSSVKQNILNVEYHGVTKELMSHQDGIKTSIHITQPLLKTIVTPAGQLRIAAGIAEQGDLSSGLLDLYKSNPKVLKSTKALNDVQMALAVEDLNMADYLGCIRKTSRNNYNQKETKMVLVSDLIFKSCQKDLKAVHTKHTFYKHNTGEVLCRVESDKLFLIDYKKDEISTNFKMC